MRRILVPLDGSPLAEAALPHALGLASRSGAELVLASVREDLASAVPAHLLAEVESSWPELHRAYLSTLSEKVGGRLEMAMGQPAQEIVGWTESLGADLVVMGTHGRRGLSRWLVGSVADKVMRHSHCPVLLVRSPEISAAQAREQVELAVAGQWPRYPRILVPLDGTALSEQSLGGACLLARQDQSELTLMRVLDFPNPTFASTEIPSTWADMVRADLDESHQRYLDEKARELETQGYKVKTTYRHGSPADRILEQTQDLIVMASQGGGFFGSVAERVVHRAECPVLLVRGRGALLEANSHLTDQAVSS
ncbi:universal stress protein [bacterium CPR1]|nr:universal stress protein [bacterium CPR1]